MLFKVAPMLSFAGHPAPAATMLYDPAKDPLWPEIKDDLSRVGCAHVEGMHDICVFQVNERP